MTAIVSTQPLRLVAVLICGTSATIVFTATSQRLEGLPAPIATLLAITMAALTVSYLIAVIVEGIIDRRQRHALTERLSHPLITPTDTRRCGHCRRPFVTVGGVAICAYCDQKQH